MKPYLGIYKVLFSFLDRGKAFPLDASTSVIGIGLPSGFVQPIPYPIEYNSTTNTASVGSSFSLSTYIPTGTAYYVDANSGNDGNSGLSWSTPLKTLYAATSKSGRGIIYLKAGVYDLDGNSVSPSSDRGSVAIIGVEPGVDIRIQELLSTFSPSGTSYVAAARRTDYDVWDKAYLDSNGFATQLTLVGSVAACQATEGTYYIDTVSKYLFVHRFGSIAPDNNLVISSAVNACLWLGNYTYYLNNLNLEGGYSCLNGSTANFNQKIYAENCTFRYARYDGVLLDGFGEVIFLGCDASRNLNDGFGYSNTPNIPGGCYISEINCTGSYNGSSSTSSSNGSSMHGNYISAVRVGGEYHHNGGPNIADVGTSKTFCVGTKCHNSITTTPGSYTDFYFDGTAWLEYCISYGSVDSLDGSGTVYILDCNLAGALNISPKVLPIPGPV